MPNRDQHTYAQSATMLEQLLTLIRQGGVRSVGQVAEELGTSPALVETMLEDLTRRGYLQPVETQCAQRCTGCPLDGQCAVTGGGRVWEMKSSGGP